MSTEPRTLVEAIRYFADPDVALKSMVGPRWPDGISSYERHRALGVIQKSAWFMLHRVRLAMKVGSLDKAGGENEADETFVGGLAKNMHKNKRGKVIKGTGGSTKTAVMGRLEQRSTPMPGQAAGGQTAITSIW